MSFDHAELRARAATRGGILPDRLALRVHRALSWLKRSELCGDDDDARFVFLWISLNAAYADEIQREGESEQVILGRFLQRLVSMDPDNLLYDLVWKKFSGPVRLLLDNPYVFQPFWDFHNGRIPEKQWKRSFEKARTKAHIALRDRSRTAIVLSIVLARLYTLRNQLVHGGATWNSSVNRDQVRDGCAILRELTPCVIHILIENPGADWGEPCYPVVEYSV